MKTFQSRQDGGRRMIWTIPLAVAMVVGTATVAVSAFKTVLPDDRSAHSTTMTAGSGHGGTSASVPTAALRDFLADTRNQQAEQPVQIAAAAAVATHNGPSASNAAAQLRQMQSPNAPLVSAEPAADPIRPAARPVAVHRSENLSVRQRREKLWSAGLFR